MEHHRLKPVPPSILAAWFLGHAWRGLLVYFQGDDAMNLYQAWILPPWKILVGNLTPFTTLYRPLGTAVYRVMFHAVGWHPLGFRVLLYALLLVNIGLLYRVARMLTGRAEIGLLAALIGSYHPRLMDLYLNGGAIYDVLCYTFFMLALAAYIERRPVVFLLFYIAALNSKEMAASLALLVLAYDWIYQRRFGSAASWSALGMTAIAFLVKKSSPSFANVPDYGMHIGLRQYFLTTRPLLAQLFFLPENALNTTAAVLILGAPWAIALASRRKPLLFAAAFATLAPLPINFITYRGFFVMYLPLAGWAIFFATALVEGRDWLWMTVWKRPPLESGAWEPERVFLFLLVAFALFDVQRHDTYRSFDQIDPSQANLRTLKQDLADHSAARPAVSPLRVLLLHDPFPRDVWDPVMLVRMHYGNPSLTVDRDTPQPEQGYDLVLDYDGRHYQARAMLP